jgi:hypothetical protein
MKNPTMPAFYAAWAMRLFYQTTKVRVAQQPLQWVPSLGTRIGIEVVLMLGAGPGVGTEEPDPRSPHMGLGGIIRAPDTISVRGRL